MYWIINTTTILYKLQNSHVVDQSSNEKFSEKYCAIEKCNYKKETKWRYEYEYTVLWF